MCIRDSRMVRGKKPPSIFFHYTSCEVAKLILDNGFRVGDIGMLGLGVYFTKQSPAKPEPLEQAMWPSKEFRINQLKANYGDAWDDPGRALSMDAVVVCFVDPEMVAEVPERPGAWALHEKHVKNEDCLLYTSPSPRDLSTSRMPSSA